MEPMTEKKERLGRETEAQGDGVNTNGAKSTDGTICNAVEANEAHRQISRNESGAIALGEFLLRTKAELEAEPVAWVIWAKANLDFDREAASNYIRAFLSQNPDAHRIPAASRDVPNRGATVPRPDSDKRRTS
jgi:hypothetical protein